MFISVIYTTASLTISRRNGIKEGLNCLTSYVLRFVVTKLVRRYSVDAIVCPVHERIVNDDNTVWSFTTTVSNLSYEVVSRLKSVVTTTLDHPYAIGSYNHYCAANVH
ncbi:hypothetical protein D3C85_1501530 [compost metagenome]